MCKICKISKLVFVVAVLCLGLTTAAQAANVVLVSQVADYDADGIHDDIGWEDWLKAEGHNVDVRRDYWMGDIGAYKIAELEAADLIIMTRCCGSSDYPSAVWNAITTPILSTNGFLARSNRQRWMPSTSAPKVTGPITIQAVVPEHPIFSGVTLDANNESEFADGITGSGRTVLLGTLNAGNGMLIARRAGASDTAIAEWEPGVEFYDGAGQFAGGKRMLFCAGTHEATDKPQGAWNLTAEGEKMFRNAINYLLGVWASDPAPADGTEDVPRDTVLSWTPGAFAVTHDVYFGTVLDDVRDASPADPRGVLASPGQDANSYDPAGLLDFGQVYYWRVDGVAAAPDNKVFRGNVWSFTAEPFAHPIMTVTATSNAVSDEGVGPERTIDGSGLNAADQHSTATTDMWLGTPSDGQPIWLQYEFDRVYKLHEMWVWNYNAELEKSVLGFGLKEVTVEYSENGTDWTTLSDEIFEQGSGQEGYAYNTAVDFGGAVAQYVRLNVRSGWGTMGRYGLSEVRFFYIPVRARKPSPASGDRGVPLDVMLTWRPGREAVSHEVYFSDDQQAVIDGTALAGTVHETRFELSGLEYGEIYYWKVNEVNDAGSPLVWDGNVWSFSTTEFAAIDDFESYSTEEGGLIYEIWIDGLINGSGSMVGYWDAPFIEQEIVHGGKQSLPFDYNNVNPPFYSEAYREFSPVQDWTADGGDTLMLYFQGKTDNSQEPLYVGVEDSANAVAVVVNPDSEAVLKNEWTEWKIPLSSFAGVNTAGVKKLYIGVGSRTNPTPGGTGLLYIDDIQFGRSAPVVE